MLGESVRPPQTRDTPDMVMLQHFVLITLILTAGCVQRAAQQTPPRPRPSVLTPRNETLDWVVKEEETPPKPVHSENPDYPLELRSKGVQGTVVVEFTIGIDGKVTRAHAVHSPHPELAQLAVAAVQRWEYVPAQRRGRPVETVFQTRIEFRP